MISLVGYSGLARLITGLQRGAKAMEPGIVRPKMATQRASFFMLERGAISKQSLGRVSLDIK